MTPKLSPYKLVGLVIGMPRQRNMYHKFMHSSIPWRKAINSALHRVQENVPVPVPERVLENVQQNIRPNGIDPLVHTESNKNSWNKVIHVDV